MFQFMFNKVQKKSILVIFFVIKYLSHSGTRIRYKNTANVQVREKDGFWDSKNNFTILLWSILLSKTSVPLKHVTQKIRSVWVRLPNFFRAFPYLHWEQLLRQRLLCRQNQKKRLHYDRLSRGDVFGILNWRLQCEEQQHEQRVSPHCFKQCLYKLIGQNAHTTHVNIC